MVQAQAQAGEGSGSIEGDSTTSRSGTPAVRVVRRTGDRKVETRPHSEAAPRMQEASGQPRFGGPDLGRCPPAPGERCADLRGVRGAGGCTALGSSPAGTPEVRRETEDARMHATEARGPLISAHALIRYVEHYGRVGGLAEKMQAALSSLAAELDEARPIKTLDTGAELWRGPRPRRARFILRDGVVVTVLDIWDGRR